MENMIEITGVDLPRFVQKVYELSVPAGLGFLHFQDGGLPIAEAKRIAEIYKDGEKIALDMDYVRGRACKMVVLREGKKLFMRKAWYDHTDAQLKELLSTFSMTIANNVEHGMACHCADCQATRV